MAQPWPRTWITKKEVAEALSVHPVTVDRLVKRKILTRYSIPGITGYRYDADEVANLYTEDHK